MAPSASIITEEYGSITLNTGLLITKYEGHNDAKTRSDLIEGTLKDRIKTINTDICEVGEEDAFFVADMGEVYRQHVRWKLNLKRVKPHYGADAPPPTYELADS